MMLKKRAVCVLSMLFVTSVVAAQEEEVDKKQIISDYAARRTEAARPVVVAGLDELRRLQAGRVWDKLKMPAVQRPDKNWVFRSEKDKQESLQEALTNILAEAHTAGTKAIEQFELGEIGELPKSLDKPEIIQDTVKHTYEVMSVVDEKNLLATVTRHHWPFPAKSVYLDTNTYWFKVNTKGLVDDQEFVAPPRMTFIVIGTKKYTTVLGGSNTVKVIEDVTAEADEEFFKMLGKAVPIKEKWLKELIAETSRTLKGPDLDAVTEPQ